MQRNWREGFFARDLIDLPRLRWVLLAVAIGVLSGPLMPWGPQ